MQSLFPQWVQDLNTALGVVGFAITVIVMLQVASIKRSFLSRARLPEILKDLERAGSALNAQLGEWPKRKNDARAHIRVASTLIATAIPLVHAQLKPPLKTTLRVLEAAVRDFNDPKFNLPDAAWDVYSEIQSGIVHLTQAVRNSKWE